ncbi:MAG: DUF5337 domain-containing protein [Pseudomonadota bacterium]
MTPAEQSKQARQAAIVIVAAFLLWMLASAVGGLLGVPVRYAFLIDLACLGALAWAMIVLFRIWLARRDG